MYKIACIKLCGDSSSDKAFFISYFTLLGWWPHSHISTTTFMSRLKYPILPKNRIYLCQYICLCPESVPLWETDTESRLFSFSIKSKDLKSMNMTRTLRMAMTMKQRVQWCDVIAVFRETHMNFVWISLWADFLCDFGAKSGPCWIAASPSSYLNNSPLSASSAATINRCKAQFTLPLKATVVVLFLIF